MNGNLLVERLAGYAPGQRSPGSVHSAAEPNELIQEILLLSCRAVPPIRRKNRDGMVTPLNADSTSIETPKE